MTEKKTTKMKIMGHFPWEQSPSNTLRQLCKNRLGNLLLNHLYNFSAMCFSLFGLIWSEFKATKPANRARKSIAEPLKLQSASVAITTDEVVEKVAVKKDQ